MPLAVAWGQQMDIFSFFSSFSFTPVTLGRGSALLKHLFNSDLVYVWEGRENGENNSFISGQGGGWRKISSFSPSYKMGVISRSSSKGGGHGEKNLFICTIQINTFQGHWLQLANRSCIVQLLTTQLQTRNL